MLLLDPQYFLEFHPFWIHSILWNFSISGFTVLSAFTASVFSGFTVTETVDLLRRFSNFVTDLLELPYSLALQNFSVSYSDSGTVAALLGISQTLRHSPLAILLPHLALGHHRRGDHTDKGNLSKGNLSEDAKTH